MSSRRAWFSPASSPVSRSSRREWWPASTTFGWMRTWVPVSSVLIESSSMSKPRSLSRSTRSLMRQRSDSANDSEPVSSFHSVAVRGDDAVGDRDRVDVLVEPAAGLQVEQFAGDVDRGRSRGRSRAARSRARRRRACRSRRRRGTRRRRRRRGGTGCSRATRRPRRSRRCAGARAAPRARRPGGSRCPGAASASRARGRGARTSGAG